MNTRQQGIAFRIWQYAEPLGWNVTYSEVAEHLRLSHQEIATIARNKGWANRFRSLTLENSGSFSIPDYIRRNLTQ